MGRYCENSVVVSGLLVAQCVFTAACLGLQYIEIAAISFERAGDKLQGFLSLFGFKTQSLVLFDKHFPT